MRILLLSAYDAQSHRHWHGLLQEELAEWDFTLLCLPPRHFSWRVRSNPLTWSIDAGDILAQHYHVVLATSMVDLATLRGLVPSLARIPTALYCHENQFVYPAGAGRHSLLEAQMVSLYGALAADTVLFNSDYNRQSFLAGADTLLTQMPDGVPSGVVEILSGKSQTLPVPLRLPQAPAARRAEGRLQLLWNHRWEFDKGPERLLALAEALLGGKLGFTLHVVGQQFRNRPDAFDQLFSLLQRNGVLGHWGYIEERSAYEALLGRCDVVLSTAGHDFQGLSVMEACAMGCTPLVPDGLVYPEWVAPAHRYADIEAAAARLGSLAAMKDRGETLPWQDVDCYGTAALIPRYRQLLAGLAT
jgi:glycosyltransferase involved in cell wall biosynthesis